MSNDSRDPSAPAVGSDEFSRRSFLKVGATGAAAVAAGAATGCAPADQSPREGGAPGSEEWWTTESFELEEVSIQEQVEGMASGRWTASDITEMYLDRIARMNREGPRLRAVIETNPEALEIAATLDRERSAGSLRGPLHGIPILVKDNIDTADRMTTTAGSLALEGSIALQDSWVVERLRSAGAIILGKANLSEWANIRSSNSSSGWSGRGGQCANPYALDRNPCGSSSGSGAGASANFCAGAIGTETNGSIVCPSSINGVVGIKPTVGLVGRSGIIPIAHTQDTAGPMTRTVHDGALILGALTGVDPRDGSTMASSGNSRGDYTQFLDAEGLRGARIGVERSYFGNNALVDDLMEQALVDMANAGAVIVDPALHPTRQQMGRPQFTVLMYELKADLAAYLATLGPDAPMRTLAEVIAFNEANAGREMPYFGQDLLIRAEESGTLEDPEYLEALELAGRLSRAEGLDALLAEHQLDAVVSPTTTPAWKTDLVNGDGSSNGSASMAAIAGYASVTVPMGLARGLPTGLLFTGGRWAEATVLRLAYAYEQATMHRVAPRMPSSLDLRNRAV
jgi:amidase